MATFWSRTLIPTSRQVPADAEVPSHQLMLRAGLIRKLTAGVYDYLPLGWRSLRKIMAIVRDEMDQAGAVEVLLPTLQPIELWEKTGRRADYGENLFVVEDRHGRHEALGPTHEEVVTELVGGYIDSYKQLPLTLYQIQTKFRDEFRPRFGVLRSREFQMKDAYSFDTTIDGLDASYQAMFDAYCRIFDRCGVPYEIVEAESGPIGGSASHEFMVTSPTGEDTILKSDKGPYAANIQKCAIGPRAVPAHFGPHLAPGASPGTAGGANAQSADATPPTGDLEKNHTPNCATIEDVCKFMKVKPRHMLKTMVYKVDHIATEEITRVWTKVRESGLSGATTDVFLRQPIVAVVRGDHEVNEAKLRAVIKDRSSGDFQIHLMDERSAIQDGYTIGFVGPHTVTDPDHGDAMLILDFDAAQEQFWACGANEDQHHLKHFNWKRDLFDPLGTDDKKRVIVADIRNANDGDPSPMNDGGVLHETKGIEIGHVFKLGTKYSEALDAVVLDENNQRVPVIMGCYGIGINRIMAAAIERQDGHDDDGIIWPANIAPYQVLITPIKYEGAVKETADRIAGELESLPSPGITMPGFSPNIDVLIDDRAERPGVKFKDADLIGVPLRITIGDKVLKDGNVEVKPRQADKAELVPIEQAAARAAQLLRDL